MPVAVKLALTYTLRFWVISACKWFTESIKLIAGEEKFNYGLVPGVSQRSAASVRSLRWAHIQFRPEVRQQIKIGFLFIV